MCELTQCIITSPILQIADVLADTDKSVLASTTAPMLAYRLTLRQCTRNAKIHPAAPARNAKIHPTIN